MYFRPRFARPASPVVRVMMPATCPGATTADPVPGAGMLWDRTWAEGGLVTRLPIVPLKLAWDDIKAVRDGAIVRSNWLTTFSRVGVPTMLFTRKPPTLSPACWPSCTQVVSDRTSPTSRVVAIALRVSFWEVVGVVVLP